MIKVFTAFSGYDSQCLALDRLGINYELVGWSEIDKFAIKAHDALFPRWADRNYGDISKVDWAKVPDFDLFTYSSPCFVAGTLVLTDRGYIPIEDVKVGDMVLTHKNRYQKVLRVGHKHSSDLYEVKGMAFDKIVCTGNHPFYTREMYRHGHHSVRAFREPRWTEAKDLGKKTYCAVAINTESKLPERGGCIDNRWGHHRVQNNLSEKFSNTSFWYLMGRYVGDGWAMESKTGKKVFICCGGRNEDKLRMAFERCDFKTTIIKEKTATKYVVCSKELYAFVRRYGKYAHGKFVDAETLALSADLLRAFVDGYTDSDGCIVGNNHKYTTVSKALVYGMAQCVAKVFNRPYAVYWTKRKPTTEIEGRTVNQRDSYQLVFHEEKHKQEKAFTEDGTIWFPIQKVKRLDGQTATVYNLEVENDNSYTANGVVVHNCQDFSQAGLQRGGAKGSGTRSSLLWECERAIVAKRPKYLLMENVAALVSQKFIKTFQSWMSLLESYGYRNYAQVLNAKDYGVPQNRERIFLVSVREDCEPKCYYFPKPQKLTRVLKDVLERNVDEKYYLKDKILESFQNTSADETHNHKFQPKDGGGIAFTVKTTAGSRVDDNFIKDEKTETENSEQC